MYCLNNKGPWLILLAAQLCIIYTLPHDSTECGVPDTAYKINLNSDCAHISPKLFCKCIYDPDTRSIMDFKIKVSTHFKVKAWAKIWCFSVLDHIRPKKSRHVADSMKKPIQLWNNSAIMYLHPVQCVTPNSKSLHNVWSWAVCQNEMMLSTKFIGNKNKSTVALKNMRVQSMKVKVWNQMCLHGTQRLLCLWCVCSQLQT